jgi:hypothetical protein
MAAPAASDLSTKQYRAGYLTSSKTIDQATGPNQGAMGILTDNPKQGSTASLQMRGFSKWAAASGTINPGDKLVPDSNGRAVVRTAPTANTSTGVITSQDVLAIALDGSSVQDTLVPVEIVSTKI